ncbi:hypothetical protein [Paraburkholderia sp. BL6665CI2N2]|uniref:hypothetical protein n=1 Tax=Paraburkholderia sp. BL6665CI2N2 TaxID=1938806 RepID=UPI0010669673|nr:hypothetical protein [Paraburkholderia sp. BL6665CI2N2]
MSQREVFNGGKRASKGFRTARADAQECDFRAAMPQKKMQIPRNELGKRSALAAKAVFKISLPTNETE